MNITEAIRQAVDKIKAARATNQRAASLVDAGSPSWRHCETIDDHLFEALKLIDEQ